MKYIFSKAYAKINMALDIKGTDSRGYHILETVMKKVSIFDRIFICREDGISDMVKYFSESVSERFKNVFKTDGGKKILLAIDSVRKLPLDNSNIAYKAASLFLDETGIAEPVFIYIDKKIPIGGGLAGGSTDGAAVLLGLNNMFDKPINFRRLSELASKLGSDVPFFLSSKPALVKGTGEIVETLPLLPKMNILLVNPGFSSSTEKAYKEYDSCKIPEDAHPDCGAMLDALYSGDIEKASENMKNVLEYPVFAVFPEISNIKREIGKMPGAVCSFMSGSGSTVVGIFDDEKNATAARDFFRKKKYSAWVCK